VPRGLEPVPPSQVAAAELSGLAVFAYGSLASQASAIATLGRDVEALAPARLHGWSRRWSQCRDNLAVEKTFSRSDDGSLPAFCLGLNVERAGDGEPGPNGALIAVTEADLDRLDVRELRYDRVDVSDAIEPEAGERPDRVITYVAKAVNFAPMPPVDAVILAGYLQAVETAFTELGEGQLDLFRATTGPAPVEVVEAVLVHDEIPPGNPRNW
jgi:cation transport regulator ChaC